MPTVLLFSNNAVPAPIADLLFELLPALIGVKINPRTHGGIAECVVANNHILCDRLDHGSVPHYQFSFELPDYFPAHLNQKNINPALYNPLNLRGSKNLPL
jgi:hypothetical protein